MAAHDAATSVEEYVACIEELITSGTADGAPVIVPTKIELDEMVRAAGRPAEELVARIAGREIRVGDVAEQAVMAGCAPAYMPVLLAAVEAFADPQMQSERWLESTAGLVPWVVVCGPAGRLIGMNSDRDAFGPGNRANASIGRAVRLCLRNLFGGTLDHATMGNGYALSCAIPDDDDSFPFFGSLQSEFGFAPDESAVLAMWTADPRLINNMCSEDPEQLLLTAGEALSTLSHLDAVPGVALGEDFAVVALGYDFQDILHQHGFTRGRAAAFLSKQIRCRAAAAQANGLGSAEHDGFTDGEFVRFYEPEKIVLLRVGAAGSVGQCTVARALGVTTRRIVLPQVLVPRDEDEAASGASASSTNPASLIYHYLDHDFTDGWAVVPPTQRAIESMIEASGRSGEDELGTFVYSDVTATVADLAVNAVLAGCLPEYMPMLVTALEMAIPYGHGYISVGSWSPWIVVNGPMGRRLGLPVGTAPFGPSAGRAATTMGRALRLAIMNIGRHRPGLPYDRAVQGQGWKYTLTMFAEDEADDAWQPLHVRRGFDLEDDVLTFVTGAFGHWETTYSGDDPESFLNVLADDLSRLDLWGTVSKKPGPFTPRREVFVIVGPDHRRLLKRNGWSDSSVQQFLYEHVERRLGDLRAQGYSWEGRFPDEWPDETRVRPLAGPDSIMLVSAGGSGPHSMSSSMHMYENTSGIPPTASRRIPKATVLTN